MSFSQVSNLKILLSTSYVTTVRFLVISPHKLPSPTAYIADSEDKLFAIRPQKDFSAIKGRSRLVSLRLLSELPIDDLGASSNSSHLSSEPSNAYDFMRRRREENGDPLLARWNASIRLDNFASLNNSPLCVSVFMAVEKHSRVV